MRADRLHVDDTPIKVLDPSRRTADPMVRGVKKGASGSMSATIDPGAAAIRRGRPCYFAPDRRGEHPQRHLATFASGVLQADAYGRFKKLYAAGTDGASRSARRRVGLICAATFMTCGRRSDHRLPRKLSIGSARFTTSNATSPANPPRMRRHVRQNHSRPLVDAFRIWCETQLLAVPGCKIACNVDPLRAVFASNSDPSDDVCQRPFLLRGRVLGDDWRGCYWSDTAGIF